MTNPSLDLADRFRTIGVKSVYGDPVDLDGSTIVPVAVSIFGFGAGEGEGNGDGAAGEKTTGKVGGSGSGGGGGGYAWPVGAYVSESGSVRFEPNVISLIVVSVPLIAVTGKALALIIKALKR
ncbi:spore germination protein GerW family protein [Labedella endophytica]|jgi:uncharacterized spore protein YtfJ|uniref:Sporulation protein n=1 Tax=Labedella endophytica TaxID=1523160 RepID=A0A433JP30_9MICO|nr:spore germination protein GerW family protein [Labedella endophytica]RUQ97548.1 hypothetical protein ELQ94_15370 [Labedella endophytica]